jgi:hypothetical protein
MTRLLAGRLTRPRPLASLAAGLALLPVAACGSGDGTIDDSSLPYSFAYPDGFQVGEKSTAPAGFGNQTIVARENGQDLVAVQTQPLRREVTPDLIPRIKREVQQTARREGRVRGRRDVRVGGLDGVSFDVTLMETGVPVNARWVYAAKDRTLYWINCQWRNDRDAVLKACDEVLRSFKPR